MPTRSSISPARVHAARLDSFWCRISTSAICSPIVSTGFSEVIGSWKIIEMALPRSARIRASLAASRSSPRKRMAPLANIAGGPGRRRRIDIAVTLLPQPDSPTMPSISPAFSCQETPSTARTMPSGLAKAMRKSSISRVGALTVFSRCAGRAGRAGRRRRG